MDFQICVDHALSRIDRHACRAGRMVDVVNIVGPSFSSIAEIGEFQRGDAIEFVARPESLEPSLHGAGDSRNVRIQIPIDSQGAAHIGREFFEIDSILAPRRLFEIDVKKQIAAEKKAEKDA